MRIALTIYHADPTRGGAERYTFDLAASLVDRGNDVTILASSFGEVPPGVKAVPLAAGGLTRAGRYERFLKSVVRETPAGRFEIVHAMLPVPLCDVYHPHAGVAAEAAEGTLAHRLNGRRNRFAAVEKKMLEGGRPPVVLCLSSAIERVVRRWYPRLPSDRLTRLFNAVDTDKFRPAADGAEKIRLRERFGLPEDKVLALMIAQDFERKGLGPTIEALKAVDPLVHLVVAGRDDQSPYRALAERFAVSDRICWVGPTDDPASLYRACDFFVLPTRHDPCSLVVLESLASGLPVITTRLNGAAEIMEHQNHGIIFDQISAGLISAAMTTLAVTENRTRMSELCYHLRGGLSWPAHIERLQTVYDGVALANAKEVASPATG